MKPNKYLKTAGIVMIVIGAVGFSFSFVSFVLIPKEPAELLYRGLTTSFVHLWAFLNLAVFLAHMIFGVLILSTPKKSILNWIISFQFINLAYFLVIRYLSRKDDFLNIGELIGVFAIPAVLLTLLYQSKKVSFGQGRIK